MFKQDNTNYSNITKYTAQPAIVAGCDPYIGICIVYPNSKSTVCVSHGSLSPTFDWEESTITEEEHFPILEEIFYQICAGFLSWPLIEDGIMRKVYNRRGRYTGDIVCPFSI